MNLIYRDKVKNIAKGAIFRQSNLIQMSLKLLYKKLD